VPKKIKGNKRIGYGKRLIAIKGLNSYEESNLLAHYQLKLIKLIDKEKLHPQHVATWDYLQIRAVLSICICSKLDRIECKSWSLLWMQQQPH